jgi:hypothetical protein
MKIKVRSQKKREAERVAKAIDRLFCISCYRRELTGIYDKSEDETTYLVIGEKYPVENPELYKADINEFITSLPSVITEIHEVIQKSEFLFRKHIPTINKRETEEQAKARQKKENKIHEEWEEKRNTEDDEFISQWGKPEKVAIPDGMMTVKLEITYDDSHPQSDYFAPHRQVGSDLCLGIVHKGPKTERLARSILAKYPELNKHKFTWHVENYSMGHGNYLISEHTGIRIKQRAYDGRQEVETRFEIRFDTYSKEMHPYKNYSPADVLKRSNETDYASQGTNVTMRLNDEKEGVELKFDEKPSEEIIASLRIAGFRWSRPKRLWYAKQSKSTITFAKKLCGSEDIPPAELQETPTETSLDKINIGETVEIPEAIGSLDEELVTPSINDLNVQTSALKGVDSETPTHTDQLPMF